jgi:hypothetical protein
MLTAAIAPAARAHSPLASVAGKPPIHNAVAAPAAALTPASSQAKAVQGPSLWVVLAVPLLGHHPAYRSACEFKPGRGASIAEHGSGREQRLRRHRGKGCQCSGAATIHFCYTTQIAPEIRLLCSAWVVFPFRAQMRPKLYSALWSERVRCGSVAGRGKQETGVE